MELEFEGSNRYFDQTYCVGKTVTDDEIHNLCQIMKERALVACKTDEERGLVKDMTKGNLLSWGLLTKREDEIFPTNAFVLMTENDFPQARIQCAVFRGSTRSEFIEMGMDIRVNLYREQNAEKTSISADKVPIKGANKSLSANEEKVMEYLQTNQVITNKLVQELCGIKDTASKNLLRKLVQSYFLKKWQEIHVVVWDLSVIIVVV